ncbi:hypothetical protein B4U80_06987, partial [Leptotrombidium deliense]
MCERVTNVSVKSHNVARCQKQEQTLISIADDCLLVANENILNVPLLCGWRRHVLKRIYYTCPCGKRFSNMKQIETFLININSRLSIEQFSFEIEIDVKTKPTNQMFVVKNDLSEGREMVKIPVIKTTNNIKLQQFEYITRPEINTNIVYSSLKNCCNCTDNCQNVSKCSCILRTFFESKLIHKSSKYSNGKYECKRLFSNSYSGIYECNESCHCNSKCKNRVAQNGIKFRLEVFETEKKGFGVRCVDDIPKGSFICTYTGKVLESEDPTETLLRDETYTFRINYVEHMIYLNNALEKDYLDKTEFIIDGFSKSNVGKFFNHSCDPNCKIQVVFINTHDFRLPDLALFAMKNIKAGSELTYNYNIEKDSDGKRLCECGTKKCKRIKLM